MNFFSPTSGARGDGAPDGRIVRGGVSFSRAIPHRSPRPLTRRDALCKIGNGFGMLAFASLVGESIARAAGPFQQDGTLDPRRLDHPARAKRVIFLFMNGGLSQVDSFDPKPMLDKYHGQPLWNSAFLPAVHQGTFIADKIDKAEKQTEDALVGKDFDPKTLISYIHNDKFTLTEQRRELDLLGTLNRLQMEREPVKDPKLEAAIQSMETAYRMQTEAPDVFDIRKESQATLKLYGPGSTARGCLMAVRLAERGVRMVQVYYAKGDPRDAHADIQAHRKNAKDSDQPFAAVIKDLKSRGLFTDTLVVCGSEFGRTPVMEVGGGAGQTQNGRDHNPFGFTMWLAGGGVKGGLVYGATDDFGFKAVDKPVHVHDLHATILHLLGIDHTKLTYRYSGRDFRLTDVSGTVIHDIIA